MKTVIMDIPEVHVGFFFLETGEALLGGYNLHRFLDEEEKLLEFSESVMEIVVGIAGPIPDGVWGIIKSGSSILLYASRHCAWIGKDYKVDISGKTCYVSCLTPGHPSRLAAAIAWSAPAPRLDINPDIIQVGCYVGQVLLRAAAMVCDHEHATVEWTALWERFYDLALDDPLLGRVDYLKVPEREYARWLSHLGFTILPKKPGEPTPSTRYTRKWWQRIQMPVL